MYLEPGPALNAGIYKYGFFEKNKRNSLKKFLIAYP